MDRTGIVTIGIVVTISLGLAGMIWGSKLAHAAGMLMIHAEMSLPDAVERCGSGWRYGCVHGAVMTYADQHGATLSLCDQFTSEQYLNCLHGVGHAFASQHSGSLSDAVALCDDIPACLSGVYMEYGAPVPCHELADRYQAYCRASEQYYAILGLW